MKLRPYLTTICVLFWSAAAYAAQAFVPDESAPRTIHQMSTSGQIQTAPTSLQLWWWNLMRQLRQWWYAFWNWLESLFPTPKPAVPATETSYLWLKVLFISALILALLAALLLVWRAFKNRPKPIPDETEMGDEELFLLPPEELRQRAARFANEGNYREALRYLYISMLMLMDARGVWHYDINRTNWEHIALLSRERNRPELVVPLQEMTRRFDRVRYGNADCNDVEWNKFQNTYGELEARLPNP
ncbi:MAG: DUF4129 domain-containing protein [Abditibacteriaceae bacterium]